MIRGLLSVLAEKKKKNMAVKTKPVLPTKTPKKWKGKQFKPVVEIVDPMKDWILDKEIHADLAIDVNVFSFMVDWFGENGFNEITGFAYQEEGVLKWATWSDTGSGGSVVNSVDGERKAVLEASKDGYYLNIQWHTHPDLGVFWSITDRVQQAARVKLMGKDNEIHFVVFDGVKWLVRKIITANGVISYNDGKMYLEGADKPLLGERPTPIHTVDRNYNWGTWSKETKPITHYKNPDEEKGIKQGSWQDWYRENAAVQTNEYDPYPGLANLEVQRPDKDTYLFDKVSYAKELEDNAKAKSLPTMKQTVLKMHDTYGEKIYFEVYELLEEQLSERELGEIEDFISSVIYGVEIPEIHVYQ
jgi:hypothetical protein